MMFSFFNWFDPSWKKIFFLLQFTKNKNRIDAKIYANFLSPLIADDSERSISDR